jgi:DNA-binding beta-propeller fold protein YncE
VKAAAPQRRSGMEARRAPAACAAALIAIAAARAGALESWIYVLSGHEVDAVDPASAAVVARTDLGRADADGLYPTPGGKAVFVTHAGAPLLTVVDGETHALQRTIPVEAGVPSGIWFAPEGTPALVSLRGSPEVVINDQHAGRLSPRQRVAIGGTDAALAFNRRGTRIYRADSGGLGFFLERDERLIATVSTGPASQWTISPDFRYLWGVREGGFVVVDEQTRRQAADRSLPVAVRPPAFAPNGDSVWLLSSDGRTLYRVSARSFSVIREVSLPGKGDAVIVADGDPWVYAADSGTLWRFDARDGGVAATVALPGGPAPAVPRTGRELALAVLRPGEGFACF